MNPSIITLVLGGMLATGSFEACDRWRRDIRLFRDRPAARPQPADTPDAILDEAERMADALMMAHP
jgi:hypothetical protein